MPALKTLSDHEILGRLAGDDRVAFNELYDRYWQHLYQMAWNVLRDKDSCVEVIQEVFVWIWEHRFALEIKSPPAYLRSAVKYKITNVLRANRAREACFVNLDQLDPGHLLFDEDPLELKELRAVIAQMIAKLPERARLIFEMSRNEHLSNKEIAERLGISEKTVENQMTIAIKKLRVSLNNKAVWLFFFL